MGTALLTLPKGLQAQEGTAKLKPVSNWRNTHDRVWIGEDFWANPMEDWVVRDGAVECNTSGFGRTVHLVTHQFTDSSGDLEMAVHVQRVEKGKKDTGGGFRIGVHSDLNEYRSNCLTRSGLNIGVVDGKLKIGRKTSALASGSIDKGITLHLSGKPAGDAYELTLKAVDGRGAELGKLSQKVQKDSLAGNIAIASNMEGNDKQRSGGGRYRFSDWAVGGSAFTITEDHKFGPILWSMYTLSDSRSKEGFVMKISALTGPLGARDNQNVELHVKKGNSWKNLGSAELDPEAWTATFRIPNWDEKKETPFKLVYKQSLRDGSSKTYERAGQIKANPTGRPLRIAALTCQNDYGFPYEPVANNVVKMDPDLVYFSGDQLYEGHGGFGLIREPAGPAILNYLRKYYQHGWAFGEAMRNAPTICIPDDHDVFHGNIWGAGGKKMDVTNGTSSNSGYREPARMVNVVHKTNAAHHPDFYDPTPVLQGITVYYGDMVYGDVGFAILGDRQFKSGPENVSTGKGRADHVEDADFDTSTLDKPGLILLGERQEKFLKEWASDWRGHKMKILLSQTLFAGAATHHGGKNGYLKADLDCGGWPQTARNRALEIIGEAVPLHINGDQHLASMVQYGIKKQRDSFWSFCTPAISAGYPRWWRPEEVGMKGKNRPKHGVEFTGEYKDGLGNLMYMYAVGNPEVASEKNRYKRAHQKGSGFGFVTVDTKKKTYLIDSFRFLIDAKDGKAGNQFPGWPLTLHQKEMRGDNIIG